MLGGAVAAAPIVAGLVGAGRRLVEAADHRLAAVQGRWTNLRVHWHHGQRVAMHGVSRASLQVLSHGTVDDTVEFSGTGSKISS